MEKTTLTLLGHLTFIAVVVWIIASAMGDKSQLHEPKKPTTPRMDPNSNVWNNSNVRGTMAKSYSGVL